MSVYHIVYSSSRIVSHSNIRGISLTFRYQLSGEKNDVISICFHVDFLVFSYSFPNFEKEKLHSAIRKQVLIAFVCIFFVSEQNVEV